MTSADTYRMKNYVIQAWQLGSTGDWEAAAQWCGGHVIFDTPRSYIEIKTLDRMFRAYLTDWIIRGVSGQFSVINEESFEIMCEPTDAQYQDSKLMYHSKLGVTCDDVNDKRRNAASFLHSYMTGNESTKEELLDSLAEYMLESDKLADLTGATGEFGLTTALTLLKGGFKVRHRGMAKSEFIILVPGSKFIVDRSPWARLLGMGATASYHGHLDIRYSSGMLAPWTPSTVEMLREDYSVVE